MQAASPPADRPKQIANSKVRTICIVLIYRSKSGTSR